MADDATTQTDERGAEAGPSSNRLAWRSWMPRAVFEAGLIVFSLLLALGISSWQEQRRIDRDIAETRTALIAELQANREMLLAEGMIPHHARLQGAMREAVSTAETVGELRQAGYILFQDGIHFPQFRDAAWRTAAASGTLQHMDRQEVFALTDAYGAQDRLTQVVMTFYPTAISLPATPQEADPMRGALMSVGLFLGDLYGGEQTIVRLQTEALVAMGEDEATAQETEQPS